MSELSGRLRISVWLGKLLARAGLATAWGVALLWFTKFAAFPGAFFVAWILVIWGLVLVRARSTVSEFRLNDHRLVFRLLGRGQASEIETAELEGVTLVPRAGPTRAFTIRTSSVSVCPRFELHELENSAALLGHLQAAERTNRLAELDRRRSRARKQATAVLPLDPALVSRLRDRLHPEERVLWVGRPSPGLLWNEIWGEFALGVLLLVVGIVPLALVLSIRNGDRGGLLMLLVISAAFTCGGVYGLTAPWRISRKARLRTTYAITDRRAIILDAIAPGNGTTSSQDYEFQPEQLLDYGAKKNRDLILATEWQRGRRRERPVPIGFLGLEDLEEARHALDRLIEAR